MFAPEAPHSNWWVEIHGKSRDPSKKITNVINPAFETFTVPKNSISYYGNRIGFSFFTYNFHPDENESLAKKREEIVKTTLFYYCSKYSDQFSAIDLNYLTTPIDIEGTKHKLSGKIKREHLGTLNCEKLKMEKEPLIPSDEYISKK